MDNERIIAWHFIPVDGYMNNTVPRRLVRQGETYSHEGPVTLCEIGLHASVNPVDALEYAPGPVVCRVECWGDLASDEDKLVCRHRKVLWLADATLSLHAFAIWCAEQAWALCPNPPPSARTAITMKRKWMSGQITDADLLMSRDWTAASKPHWNVAKLDAVDAARSASTTARDSAAAAFGPGASIEARDAAWNAALLEQNRVLNEMLEELGGY